MTEHGFPKVIRARCHPSVATASCNGRREAVKRGEMFWDWSFGGWVSIMNPLRTATWEAVYRTDQNHNNEPYVLEICPYCGSALPDLSKTKQMDSRTT